jgi:hypothetical protein
MSLNNVAALAAVLAALAGVSTPVSAQHEGHKMPGVSDTTKKKPATMPKAKALKASAKKKTTAKPRSASKASATKASATKASATKRPAAKKAVSATKKLPPTRPATTGTPSHSDSLHKAMSKPSADTMKMDAPHTGQASDPAGKMPMSQPAGASMPGASRVHSGHDMMSGPLSLSMDRMGSGTTWIPDAVTVPSRHRMFGAWEVMAHGFVFAQYDHQSGPRGDDQLGSLNWTMLMASRELAGGHLQARTMLSLDPGTVTSRGYPLLLQTGEAFDGEPLHDRQHPHDFFMEVGLLYQREFNPRIAWSLYAAPSGEPALGPVAFMHRPSAMDNPAAPLSHHWQDATHVSFGVVTAGIFTRRWQLEGSVFNGREPDEHRWNFDPIKLDSYSGRVTANPTNNWSLTAGYGYLKSPEELHPDEPMHRITASALHGRVIGADGQAASALVWGVNRHGGDTKPTHTFLVENETILDKRNTIFGRAELVQKTGEDLALDESSMPVLNGSVDVSEMRFNVGAVQLGYIRELARRRWATIGLGAGATLNFVPKSLEDVYGSRNPVGTFFFLRVRPFHLNPGVMQRMNGMGTSRRVHVD